MISELLTNRKSEILYTLNNKFPQINLLNLDTLNLNSLYSQDSYPIEKLVELHFGTNNYKILESYLKHNVLDSQTIFGVCQYFKTFDNVCEYLVVLEHLFYFKEDTFEFFNAISFVCDVEEIASLSKKVHISETNLKLIINNNHQISKKGTITYTELKKNVIELESIIKQTNYEYDFKYATLKLKRYIKNTTPISVFCN